MKNRARSTTPNAHFDSEKPEAYICCVSCKNPLWEMQVRTTQGVIVSTKTLPVGKNTEKFENNRTQCPLCGQAWLKEISSKEKKILFRSVRTGQEFFA